MSDSEYRFIPSPYPPRPLPKTVVVDPTLTKEGYAADAKVTGDALNQKLDKDIVGGKSISVENTKSKDRLEITGFVDAGFLTGPVKDKNGNLSWVTIPSDEMVTMLRTKVCNIIKNVIPTIENEIEALDCRLKTCSNQIKARLGEDEKQIVANEQAIEKLKLKISKFSTVLDELKSSIDLMNSAIEKLDSEKADLQLVLKNDKKLSDKIQKLDEIKASKEELEAKIQELSDKIKKAGYATKKYVDEQDKALSDQITKIKSQYATKAYVDEKDAELTKKINTKASKTYVDAQDAALNTRINDLEGRLLHIQDDIIHVLGDISVLKDNFIKLQKDVSDISEAVLINAGKIKYLEQNAVLVEPQTWTDGEKQIARTNIGAVGSADIEGIKEEVDEALALAKEANEEAEIAKGIAYNAAEKVDKMVDDVTTLQEQMNHILPVFDCGNLNDMEAK